ncbi:AN1-type zinc finger protein 2A isoform X1 [Alexandromys fortis]|uniref:AN1-type zinc finger protein 2A isoform X1 n=1 Tax=Alexandromys fortis TaxID=100897 RepID=UPI0021533C44|nr:AN1-type zinc finger protein 2A isoform X1 [Microtus fortis]
MLAENKWPWVQQVQCYAFRPCEKAGGTRGLEPQFLLRCRRADHEGNRCLSPPPATHESQDVQVPVCPLCNVPIPVKRGEIPDVVVGEHMDRDCTFHPGKNQKKVFTHRCSKEGCRKKEMLQLACAQCHSNFCIQHRHPLDHNCQAGSSSASRGRPSASSAPEQKPSGISWLAQQLRRTVK